MDNKEKIMIGIGATLVIVIGSLWFFTNRSSATLAPKEEKPNILIVPGETRFLVPRFDIRDPAKEQKEQKDLDRRIDELDRRQDEALKKSKK
ncbi:MAG: hypothetical protein HYR84_01030 [Planctomycetes bacterium]|nr:hypothetical protein [Planctomycetota bacterium]